MQSLGARIIIFLIAFVIVFNIPGLSNPIKKAEALTVVCTNCSTEWSMIMEVAETVASKIQDAYQWLEEKMGKSLRDLIAKRIIDYIVDQTVQWVQGGGKPKFVSDWNSFLKTAGDIAFDTIVKQVGLARICEPFNFSVRVSLLPVPEFSQRLDCTLDKVVSNIRSFYRDFRQGGWLAYNEAWKPQGNFFGTQMIIADQLLIESAKKTKAAENEALAGKGFLNVKNCIEYNNEGYQQCVASGLSESECKKAACVKEETITPGDTVGQVVARSLTSDIEWGANIQSWTAALINAVINRLVKEGISGMKNSLSEEQTSYRPPEYQNLVNQELESQKQQMTSELRKFRDEKQYILNAKYKSLSFADRTLVVFQTIKTKNCAVSDSEIQAVQADDTRLKTETADLEKSVKELTTAINKVGQAVSITALASLNQETLQVFNKYNSSDIQTQIITGSARQAADQEAQTKQNELNNAQARLDACLVPPPTESR